MNDKALVLGKGFIGSRIAQELGCETCVKKVYSYKDAQEIISEFSPKVIINCAGSFGSNVDECEKDIDDTLSANTFVPVILGELAIRNNIRLVHISSGCIFHYDYAKDAPINEESSPDFLELFYSRTKIYAEAPLLALSRKYPVLIVRIRVPLDNRPHPRNILTKLIKYKKIIDLPNSVTYVPDFIEALRHLIATGAKGIYNVANKGGLKYPQLMQAYKKFVPDFDYEVIDYSSLNLVRTNLLLSVMKLEDSGFRMRGIEEVLEECVREYIKY